MNYIELIKKHSKDIKYIAKYKPAFIHWDLDDRETAEAVTDKERGNIIVFWKDNNRLTFMGGVSSVENDFKVMEEGLEEIVINAVGSRDDYRRKKDFDKADIIRTVLRTFYFVEIIDYESRNL